MVIVSTVRARETLVHYDERHHLGFLSNPKRFNVTISRAQALLIVIGNPHVLCMDYCWKTLVRYPGVVDGVCLKSWALYIAFECTAETCYNTHTLIT